jgi:hypothetical protein
MTIRTPRIALVASGLLLACSDGHRSSSSGGFEPDAQTVTQAASAQISFRTTDTAQPIEANTLRVSGSDTDDTLSPQPID